MHKSQFSRVVLSSRCTVRYDSSRVGEGEYTRFPCTTGAFSFSVWLALMISLDDHSGRGSCPWHLRHTTGSTTTSAGPERLSASVWRRRLKRRCLLTRRTNLHEDYKETLIEFLVYCWRTLPRLRTPLHQSCTSLPRILAGTFPNFFCQRRNGTD